MAVDSMRKAYARDEVRELIEAREKAERDQLSRLHQARKEGRAEGREEGREEGRQEGLRSAALGMASAGFGREQIAKTLGVPLQQLDNWLS